jgi:hypothetical protein
MVTKAKTQKNIIKETIQELEDEKAGLIIPDDEFEPSISTARRIAPGMFQRKPSDEIAVDELLAGLSNKAGWYLKLSKEVAANEYQFKIKITDFEAWADLELEIVQIVRSNTKRDPRRWGSGRYMVVAWNENGVRDKKPPRYIEVDAEEPVNVNEQVNSSPNVVSPSESLGAVAELMKSLNLISPTTSPSDHLKMLTESYLQGQQAAGTKESSGNQMSMMMMTMMMGMMKEFVQSMRPAGTTPPSSSDTIKDMLTMMTQFGIIGQPKEKSPDLLEQIGKFKDAGLIPQSVSTDPMEQITKLKSIVSLFSELTPGTEPPSIINKLIDVLAPALPGMIANISNTVDKVAVIKKQAMESQPGNGNGNNPKIIRPQQVVYQVPPSNPQPESHEPPPTTFDQPKEDDMLININKFTSQLYDIVISNDTTRYSYISETLRNFFGDAIETGLRTRVMNADTLIEYIKSFDTKHYTTPENSTKLQTYVQGYVDSIQGNVTTYSVKCSKCQGIIEFDSKEEWDTLPDAEKICGYENGGTICDGKLEEIK